MSIEAMKQALQYIEANADSKDKWGMVASLRQAIEQAEKQEPVADVTENGIHRTLAGINLPIGTKLYTTSKPQQAEKQEPVAWMTINAYGEEDDIHYENPEGHLPEGWTYKPLYTHPPQARQTQDEPLGYWNAVEGWVELPEEDNKPAAWVEPEFWEHLERVNCGTAYRLPGEGRQPLYTTPQPQREWVGLTDEEIKHAPHHMVDGAYHYSFKQGAQWAEAKLKEKNT